jgi:hypothetical protein
MGKGNWRAIVGLERGRARVELCVGQRRTSRTHRGLADGREFLLNPGDFGGGNLRPWATHAEKCGDVVVAGGAAHIW